MDETFPSIETGYRTCAVKLRDCERRDEKWDNYSSHPSVITFAKAERAYNYERTIYL